MEEGVHLMPHCGSASWRSQVLQGMLWVTTLTGVPATVYVLVINSLGLTRPATVLAMLLAAVVVLVTFSRRWPFTLRAAILIGIAYTGGVLTVLYYGFVLGSGLLMLLVVVLCGLFFGRTWLWAALLVTGGTLVSIAWLHVTGVMATQRLDLLDLSQGPNVVRVTLAYLVLAGTIAVSVSFIVRHIERSLQESSEALARYEAERLGRTEAEAALKESEQIYRHLVENINDVIYAMDEQGVFTYLSPAVKAHSGYTPAELIGRVFSDFIYEQDRLRLLHQFETILGGHLEPCEFRIVIKSGDIRWVRSASRPLYQDERVVGLQGVYIDITDKKELEEQLRQAYKMEAMGTLASGIAHEFNNLLSAILGFTDLTQRTMPLDSPARANLQHVLQAGERAKDLVQQILAFSRQTDPRREPLSLSQVIQDMVILLRASLPTTIDLRLDLSKETGTILANATQLHQILMNLCSNAEYAMRDTGGILEISVDTVEADATPACPHPDLEPGLWVRLTVRDTGAGIPADIVNHIFDPFFTTKGSGEGTGLGLAIVHGIVTSHSGAITVASQAGEGTTYTLYFPQLLDRAVVARAKPVEALSPSTSKGRILFVDDEEMLARLGQQMLEHLGYEVVTHTRSLEALAAFQAAPDAFDLVIADQTMPVMTGELLVQELRRLRPDIPIILCTGFSYRVTPEKAQALGIDALVMKPAMMQELGVVMQRVFAQRAGQLPPC